MRVMNGYPPAGPPGYGPPPSGYGPAAAPLAPNAPVQQPFAQQQPAGGFGYAPQQHPQQPYGPSAYGPAPSSYNPPPAYGYGAPPGMQQQQGYGYAPASSGAPSLRWWVLGSFVGAILFSFVGVGISAALGGEDGGVVGSIASLVMMLGICVYAVTALMWLYKSWEMVSPSCRVTNGGVQVTPGTAVGYLFIPFYNLYWYFIASVGLTSALNRALASYGSPKRASSGLATAAAIMQVIPYVNLLAPFLWIPFMLNVESAKREYARVSGSQFG